jgi:hypothetical protein
LPDSDFDKPRRRSQGTDCNKRNRSCLAEWRLDLVCHQYAQAQANGCARHYQQRINRKLRGGF